MHDIILESTMESLVRRIWSLLDRCLLCHAATGSGTSLCQACMDDVPVNRHACRYCALPLTPPLDLCAACSRKRPPWDAVWVPFRYAWPLDQLETRYKFRRQLVAGRILADLCRRHPPRELPGAIVPVPLHRERLRLRGYDQALELARPLARHWSLPLFMGYLHRARMTQAQSGLDARARRRNVRGAFVVHKAHMLPDHVAVFDDVMTTGATLRACVQALRAAGVARVDAWAMARVAGPG